jgi:N-acetyltransferase
MTETTIGSKLPKQPTLRGSRTILVPLAASHEAALLSAAADGELWNLKVTIVPGPVTICEYISHAIAGRDAGTVMPFLIALKENNQVVGTTRYLKIDQANRTLEIGYTWLAASFQRSFVNTEAKYLLLRYAFEELKAVRVQFITDELNERSRVALLRIGSKQEGIIRHERIMPDGRKRNSALYSIIDTEWPVVRTRLQEKLGAPASLVTFDWKFL